MAGILQSREDDPSIAEELQSYVFVANEVLGIDEDPADEVDELLLQLDIGIIEMANKIEDLKEIQHKLSLDVVNLTLQLSSAVRRAASVTEMLAALAAPIGGSALNEANKIIRKVGNEVAPGVLEFSEIDLLLATESAIQAYINKTAASAGA